jgi:hypothetical protein
LNATGNAISSLPREFLSNRRPNQLRRHTQRFAYYASLNGNRSNYGLQTPIPQVVHDAENGYGGFASFIFNHDSQNQFRWLLPCGRITTRSPSIPIPTQPEIRYWKRREKFPATACMMPNASPMATSSFPGFTPSIPLLLLTLSPFYHYNAADYQGGPERLSGHLHRKSGCQLRRSAGIVNKSLWRNDLEVGVYGFFQHQYITISITNTPMALPTFLPLPST